MRGPQGGGRPMHHGGTEGTEGSIAVDYSPDAAGKGFGVEVDQETEADPKKLEICEKLGAVYGIKSFDGLHLHHETPLDEEVDSVRGGDPDALVPQRHLLLLLPANPSQGKLVRQ